MKRGVTIALTGVLFLAIFRAAVFLGLAALGSVVLSALSILGGILRMFKPNVHDEESKRFKIGRLIWEKNIKTRYSKVDLD
jgi:hypothetical protein